MDCEWCVLCVTKCIENALNMCPITSHTGVFVTCNLASRWALCSTSVISLTIPQFDGIILSYPHPLFPVYTPWLDGRFSQTHTSVSPALVEFPPLWSHLEELSFNHNIYLFPLFIRLFIAPFLLLLGTRRNNLTLFAFRFLLYMIFHPTFVCNIAKLSLYTAVYHISTNVLSLLILNFLYTLCHNYIVSFKEGSVHRLMQISV